MDFKSPETLNEEHLELHKELAGLKNVGGDIGEAADLVIELMHPHFMKEEEYAMPPLGLLKTLATEEATPEMKAIIDITDRLKMLMPRMLEEHQQIFEGLLNLANVATKENKLEYASIAKNLIAHVKIEEEFYYPAALLVGEYLKLKLNKE
ncbi:MAG: hypothetical protein HZA08_05170 [Nitrospirae bacterium]|nr:hypothetical protein [Nitrospirota bacterium]